MSSRKAERMMQPARQILAMVPSGSDQSHGAEALAITSKPWA